MPLASSNRSVRDGRLSRTRRSRRIVGAAFAALLAVALTACTQDSVAQQYLDGDDKGYISSEFTVVEIAPADRGEPVEFAGITEAGDDFTSSEIAGDVAVVNFWYASCGPCRGEAKDLEAVWQEYEGEGVSFVGVNTYDQPDTARAFADDYGITYPSLIDVDNGDAKLAFANVTPIQATPTTLVLDKQGRVAARIIGQLKGPSVLSTLVKDALAESA